MGDPIYEAKRARELAEAEARRAAAEVGKQTAQAVIDFLAGRAALVVTAPASHQFGPLSWSVRFVRDPPPQQQQGENK